MAGNVRAVGGVGQAPVQPDLCSKLYELTEVIAQIAIKVLFVTGSILMAAAAFPIGWHAIVIPLVAVGTTAMAGFFYPVANLIRGPLFAQLQPLIRPVQVLANGELPADFPVDCPRGFQNISQNCAFNSMAQFLDSDPQLAHWMRHPLTDDMDMPAFRNAMAGYNPPANLLDQFNVYFEALPAPHPPIPAAFSTFLQAHVPPLADMNAFNELRGTYQNLQLVQGPFSQFYRANDAAVQARQAVSLGNSQNLRVALSQVTALIDPSPHHQMDIAEVMDPYLAILPNIFKTHIETIYHFNTAGLPDIAEPPLPKHEMAGCFSLPITGDDLSLRALFHNYCNSADHEPQKYWGVDRVRREYPVERVEVNLIEPPPALRFQFKRFSIEIPPVSLLSRWFPSIFPPLGARGIKIDTPIECPEEFSVTLKTGQVCRYRLASFVNHQGSCGGGHYTSAKIVNGHKYLISDRNVTLVGPAQEAEWNERLRHSYLVCYLPVPDAAAPAV